jgi:type IV pilus assembly protein PilM
MQKVIGLDIGSYSIKAVEIINTFKSYEITNFYENVIPHLDNVPLEVLVPNCMEQLFRENQLTADRILTAMPGQFISSRVLPFAFSDPSKIEKAVFVEIEEAVPFNMDDMILDHQILGSSMGKTFALAVMTRKIFLKNFLDLLQRIQIDPKLVDVDSLAFYNLSSYMNVEPGECFAMVDCGHEKTSLCIVRDGVLRMFRSINLGGRYITEFLARDLEVSFQEAQRVKHNFSRILCDADQGTELSGDERLVAERMTLATSAIVKELGRTFYAFKTWEKTPITKLFVSGGTSKIRNFTGFLEDQLELKALNARLDQTSLKIAPHLTESMATIPQGVAIGIRTVSTGRRNSQINLRRGEFAYVQNYENIFKYFVTGGKVLAVGMLLLMVSYGVKFFFYNSQINALKEQYRKELTESFPSMKKKYATANVEFKVMAKDGERSVRNEISQKKKAVEFFIEQNSGSVPLMLLKKVSDTLPKEVKIDVTSFDFKAGEGGVGKLSIKGETDNYDTHSQILKAFEGLREVSEVKDAGTSFKPGSNQKVLQFRITATHRFGNETQDGKG